MILIDTNVLSEPLKRSPNPAVVRWIDSNLDQIAVPVFAISETTFGIHIV